MKVGDLVTHNSNGVIGLIVEETTKNPSMMNPSMERIYMISWTTGGSYHCITKDFEVINESR